MKMIRIVNKKRGESGIYIGRPSPLGNPYVIGRDGSRKEVITLYETWLKEKLEDKNSPQARMFNMLKQRYAHFSELSLQCWCAPAPCHGDVIKKLILEDSK